MCTNSRNAMDNASKNAKDMIGRLTMQYNRGRQAAITNELVDIITGALLTFRCLALKLTRLDLNQVQALCSYYFTCYAYTCYPQSSTAVLD